MAGPSRSNQPIQIAIIVVSALVIAAGAFLILSNNGQSEGTSQTAHAPEAETSSAPMPEVGAEPEQASVLPAERDAREVRFLPDEIVMQRPADSPTFEAPKFKKGTERLVNVRQVVAADEMGGFLNPRISPDGLQIMLTRPGYRGIYVVPARGGEPELIVDANAFGAEWTPDGRIKVRQKDGTIELYEADGSLSEVKEREDQLAYSEGDAIYVRPEEGAPAVPLTESDDRYIAPRVSPDGKKVAYIGLNSGLWVADVEGGEPTYLGYGGNNVSWLPNGEGLVFDLTQDDGHNITGGDLYFLDSEGGTLANLTEGDEHVSQFPSIGPDGESVAYESEGGIYLGSME